MNLLELEDPSPLYARTRRKTTAHTKSRKHETRLNEDKSPTTTMNTSACRGSRTSSMAPPTHTTTKNDKAINPRTNQLNHPETRPLSFEGGGGAAGKREGAEGGPGLGNPMPCAVKTLTLRVVYVFICFLLMNIYSNTKGHPLPLNIQGKGVFYRRDLYPKPQTDCNKPVIESSTITMERSIW